MERIEEAVRTRSSDLEPLVGNALVQPPPACVWKVVLAAVVGGAAGWEVGRVNCQNHGCVHHSETVEAPDEMGRLSVGDLLAVRNDAATSSQ